MALTLDGVSYSYAAGTSLAQPAVDGVSLSVEVGELLVVLGPSGSGKTTVLRLAAGLLEPTAGTVMVDGREAKDRDRGGERVVVGLAFQRPETQFFAATVEADVAFGPRNLGMEPNAAIEAARLAMETVGLDPAAFGERTPFNLSGGEARRAALAGVLAMSPRYLLLDEPTCGLDVSGRRAVGAAIGRVRDSTGVIVVTHDAEEFLDVAERVMLLLDGRTVFEGGVDALLSGARRLEDEGLWTPPESVRAQTLAARGDRSVGAPVLDIESAARRLAGAMAGA